MNHVPNVSSKAGSCLTMADWALLGVDTLAFSLESLLIKPGLEVLKKIPNLKHYFAWSGGLILNAHTIQLDQTGNCTIISSFDGCKIKLSAQELSKLFMHLNPDVVILPRKMGVVFPEIWDLWDKRIKAFIHDEDWAGHGLKGAYGVWPKQVSTEIPFYVLKEDSKKLPRTEADFVELDAVLEEALEARVYTEQGLLDLKDKCHEQSFEPIDKNCRCFSCTRGLSRAYLHHLFFHTPLLCQRFLIGHNMVSTLAIFSSYLK